MKDPDMASEQRRQMNYQDALSVDYNEAMRRAGRLYRQGRHEEARRLVGRAAAASLIRLQHEN